MKQTSRISQVFFVFWALLGAFLAAFALDVFFIPNQLIDGGTVGVAMIIAKLYGQKYLPFFLLLLNIPFVLFGWRHIGKAFLGYMAFSNLAFSGFLFLIQNSLHWQFHGESIEVVVIGGAILGIGLGLIIRMGGCLDGTEILAIVANQKTGLTVGSVVLGCNIFVFTLAGIVFQDWHPPLLSFIAFMVASRVMDATIVGLDETKSVLIISNKYQQISKAIMEDLGLGLTIMYGRGGFSNEEKELIYVICERLQLAELKSIIFRVDPGAFVAIENIHEVANGNQNMRLVGHRMRRNRLISFFRRRKHASN